MIFSHLLVNAGITKAELARRLGLSKNTVAKWGEKPKAYAVAYLKLLIEYNKISQIPTEQY